MLELRNVSYQAAGENGPVGILRDINLCIEDKRFLVITGPNGGGKTTLAKIIMGIYQPTQGQILWNGTDITGLSISERAKLGIAYGFQQPPRFKGLKVRDLLSIAAGRPLSHDAACAYLTRVGLCARDYLERDVDTSLSGGEVKRVEIATVLARQSALMIFDEPEAGIDLWSFNNLIEVFNNLRQQDSIGRQNAASIIVISHQERILAIADELVLLSGGQIASQGAREEILPQLINVDYKYNCKGGQRND